jgi:hypothetical protein
VEVVAKLLLAFATGRLGVLEIWRKLQDISETPRLFSPSSESKP